MPSVRFLVLLLPQREQQFEFGSERRPFQTRLCSRGPRAHVSFEFGPKTGAVDFCIPTFHYKHVFIGQTLHVVRRTAERTTFCLSGVGGIEA